MRAVFNLVWAGALVGALLFSNGASSQDLLDIKGAEVFRLDIRVNKNADNFNVALFMARDMHPTKKNPGHAYVATARFYEDSGGYWGDTWLFGMYPKATDAEVFKSFFTDESVPRGKTADIVKDKKPDAVFIVWIDNAQRAKLDDVKAKWEKYRYDGFRADCVSFLYDAAKAVGLKINNRLRIDSPSWSLKKIVRDNDGK